ncbi:hypothetical protein pb186bvf_015247 [Paramecium bursaria]
MSELTIPCGRFTYEKETKKATRLNEPGQLILNLNLQNELYLCWVNTETSEVQFEQYLIKGDVKFEKVKGINRVLLLKFESYDDKFFFWIQDPDSSKDDLYIKRFNEIVQQQVLDDAQDQIQTQQQLPQQPQAIQSQAPPQQIPQLQQQTIQQTQPQLSQNRPQQNQQQPNYQEIQRQLLRAMGQQQATTSLVDILTPEFLKSIAQDEEYLNNILLLLPEEQRDPDQVLPNLLSPQFQQALQSLTQALQTQEYFTVISSLGFNPNSVQFQYDGVLLFLSCIIDAVRREEGNQQ